MNKFILLFFILALVSISGALADYYYGEDDRGVFVEGMVRITPTMENALENLPYVWNVEQHGDYTRVYYNPRFTGIEFIISRVTAILERNNIDAYHISGVIIPFCAWDYGRSESVGFYISNGGFTIVRNHPLCRD